MAWRIKEKEKLSPVHMHSLLERFTWFTVQLTIYRRTDLSVMQIINYVIVTPSSEVENLITIDNIPDFYQTRIVFNAGTTTWQRTKPAVSNPPSHSDSPTAFEVLYQPQILRRNFCRNLQCLPFVLYALIITDGAQHKSWCFGFGFSVGVRNVSIPFRKSNLAEFRILWSYINLAENSGV